MFDWLYEGRLTVYLALAGAAVVAAALWARDGFALWTAPHNRWHQGKGRPNLAPIALSFVLLLAGGYFLLDRLVETRREQITRKVHEMAAAVRPRDFNRLFEHVSTTFKNKQFDSKQGFREFVESQLRANVVTEVVVWDVKVADSGGEVEYMAKPRGGIVGDNVGFPVRAEFVRDADGHWRMRTFTVFNPYVNTREEMSIPRLR